LIPAAIRVGSGGNASPVGSVEGQTGEGGNH
jgi:hypothetical protein